MSLRTFHIFFVTLATILLLAMGGWEMLAYTRRQSPADLLIAMGAFFTGGMLICYGRWFIHKIQEVN